MRDNGRYVNKKGRIVKHQNHIFRTSIIVLILTAILFMVIAAFLGLIAGKWVSLKPDFLFGTVGDLSCSIIDRQSMVLSYIGAIIGGMASGIVAIVGVYWTINYERNKDREEKRIDKIPMVAAEAYFVNINEEKYTKWDASSGYIRIPFGINYEILELYLKSISKLKAEWLLELENEIKENPEKNARIQIKYDNERARIESCDITTADGSAALLKNLIEIEKDTIDLGTKKEMEMVIDHLEQMERLGYHDIIPRQKKKKHHESRHLYVKSKSGKPHSLIKNFSELESDYNNDVLIEIKFENSGGIGYLQEIISEDGEVWKCDLPIFAGDNGNRNWVSIITEKNIFSKIGFWIKYKDVLNNSYYQKFMLQLWPDVSDFNKCLEGNDTLEIDAPYLEV